MLNSGVAAARAAGCGPLFAASPVMVQVDDRSSVSQASEGGRFTEEEFIGRLRTAAGHRAVRGFDRLHCWSRTNFEWVYWGTGRKTPTFLAGIDRWPDGRFLNFLAVWPSGLVYIEMRFLRNFAPFDRAQRREQLRDNLAHMSTIQLSRASWRLSFEVASLADDQTWTEFTIVVQEAVTELLSARVAAAAATRG